MVLHDGGSPTCKAMSELPKQASSRCYTVYYTGMIYATSTICPAFRLLQYTETGADAPDKSV